MLLVRMNNNSNLLPVEAMIDITLSNFWQDIVDDFKLRAFCFQQIFCQCDPVAKCACDFN